MRSINAGTFNLLFNTTSLRVIIFLPTNTLLSCALPTKDNIRLKKTGMIFFIIPANYYNATNTNLIVE